MIIRIFILLLIAVNGIIGCARISIVREIDGVKTKAVYWRGGSQNLENLKVEFDDAGGIKSVNLGKQHSSDLTKALTALKKVIERVPIPVPIQ